MNATTRQRVYQALSEFEKMEFRDLPRGNGAGLVKQINDVSKIKGFQNDLDRLEVDDMNLWELRLNGKERVWFVESAPNLFLLWWDPNHSRYPTRHNRARTGN